MSKLLEFDGQLMTQAAIAKLLGISRQAVYSRIKHNGSPYLKSYEPRTAAVNEPRVRVERRAMYKGELHTIAEIAAAENITTISVYKRLRSGGTADRLCVRCKKPGHRAKQCSLAPNQQKPRKMCTCSACEESGHNLTTCVTRSAPVAR